MRTSRQMFARSASESRYPQLWRGIVGAWCPSLGPTGASLRDWSGRANHGTLTNLTLANSWARSHTGKGGGSGALLLDGTGYVAVTKGFAAISGVDPHGVSIWVNPSSLVNSPVVWSRSGGSGEMYLQVAALNVFWQVGASFRTYTYSTTTSAWTHFFASKTGSGDNGFLYINGVAQTPSAGTIASTPTLSDMLIGAYNGAVNRLSGYVDDLQVFNSLVSASEVSQIYAGGAGRAKAFEPRERRRVRAAAGGRLLELRRRACA